MNVSVVVEVINIDEYLLECIDSIVNQTLDDVEMFLCIPNHIDTDLLMNKIKYFVDKYINIKILFSNEHTINKCKNDAINLSKGKYIIFLDSNYILESQALEMYYQECESNKLQILSVDYKFINKYRNMNDEYIVLKDKYEIISKDRYLDNNIINGMEYLEKLLIKEIDIENINIYVYRRMFILSKNIYFDELIHCSSKLFLLKSFICCDYIRYKNYCLLSTYKIKDSENNIKLNYDYSPDELIKIENLLNNIEDVKLYNLLVKYIVIYLNKHINFLNEKRDLYKLNKLKKYIEDIYIKINTDLLENKIIIELDILYNSPHIYNRMKFNYKKKFYNKEYNNIRNLDILINSIKKEKKMNSEVISQIISIICSHKKFLKYKSCDNLYYLINDIEDKKELPNNYLEPIEILLKQLINDLNYEIDKKIEIYSRDKIIFENILCRFER